MVKVQEKYQEMQNKICTLLDVKTNMRLYNHMGSLGRGRETSETR